MGHTAGTMKFGFVSAIIFAMLWGLVSSQPARAQVLEPARSTLLIIELQPESKTSGSEELIRIYNPNEQPVDITDWELQYRSASQTTSRWTTKATIACLVPAPTCRLQLAGKSALSFASYQLVNETVYPLKSGMALSGGQVRLVQKPTTDTSIEPIVEDMIGYGTASVAEGGHAAPVPEPGVSIVRRHTAQQVFIDTNDNLADFLLDKPVALPPNEPEQPAEEPKVYLSVSITELLPDPLSPLQDATDEFIELYNPHDVSVDLTGYILQTGSGWHYKFVIDDLVIPPQGYIVLTAEQTGLSLSNAGSSVRLLDPTEAVVDETLAYGKAEPGQSWMKDEAGMWSWTVIPTPGAVNQLVVNIETPKSTAAKKSTTKAPAAKKPAAIKTVAAAKPKQSSTKQPKQSAANQTQQVAAAKPTNYWLIWSVAALAGGYMIYEYRADALRSMRKIRERVKTM